MRGHNKLKWVLHFAKIGVDSPATIKNMRVGELKYSFT